MSCTWKRLIGSGLNASLALLCAVFLTCSEKSTEGVPHATVTGTVYVENTTGTIPKVRVAIADKEYTTVTNGDFFFAEIPFGEHTITAAKDGYEPYSREISVAGATNIEIRLQRVLSD